MIERQMDPHAQNVLSWRETLSTMPDSHFFELIHMYLGEIKTPYNKQKLIEELSSFLRKEENKSVIFNLLSESDILLLNAINFIHCPSQEKLSAFFSNSFSYADLYERLVNLEERLLIFKKSDPTSYQPYFCINPLLSSCLSNILDISVLLPSPKQNSDTFQFSPTDEIHLSSLLLVSLYIFVNSNPDICKTDGTFKKRIETILPSIFPFIENTNYLQNLIHSLTNLSLFTQTENELLVNKAKWQSFASLPIQEQYVYIAISKNRVSQDQLLKNAVLLTSILNSIPEEGYTKTTLYRCAFIINEKLNADENLPSKKNRLSSILDNNQTHQVNLSQGNMSIIKDIIENAIYFGIIQKSAMDVYDEPIYTVSDFYKTQVESSEVPALSIDAGFSAMILPNISLEKILPVIECMELVRFDTVLQAEITRKACMACFDKGIFPKTIYENLSTNSSHELSQNLLFSIEDWYSHYKSVELYCGYVLKVAESKQVAIENNPELSSHIKQVLAKGIYLLDYESAEQAQASIEKSQLDFIGAVRSSTKKLPSLPFVSISNKDSYYKTITLSSAENTKTPPSIETRESLLNEFQDALNSMDISKEQAEGLRNRINRKIIISKVQLRAESVKPEKTEAFGMDFSGKIHIIESAISTKSLIEVSYDDSQSSNGIKVHLATPLSLERDLNDTYVNVKIEPEHTLQKLSLGTARSVKRIRGSILKEALI